MNETSAYQALSGKPQRGPLARALRRVGWALLIMSGLGLLIFGAATQWVAYRLGYHSALGSPLVGHFYAPWAIWHWMHQPWPNAKPAISQGQAIISLSATLATALFLLAAERARKKPKRHDGVHGTARFANEAELRKSRLLPAKRGAPHEGLYLAAWPHKGGQVEYLRHAGQDHVLVVAPPRIGKTQGPAVMNLLSWPHSALVHDTKGELYQDTAGWRKKHARNHVIRWEPGASEGTAQYNPLDEVRLGTADEHGDVATIIESVVDPTGAGLDGKDHWMPTAASLLIGVTLYQLHKHRAENKRPAALPDVRRALQDPDKPADVLFQAMVDNRLGDLGTRHETIAEIGRAQLDRADKERSSVTSTAVRMMRIFDDPTVSRNCMRSDFRIADLMDSDRPVTLYKIIPEDRRLQLRPLMRLFLTLASGRLMSAQTRLSNGRLHRHPLLLVGDEFMAYGEAREVVDRLSRCAGADIRALLIVQSYQQIINTYGKSEPLTGQCSVQVFYPPNDDPTAEYVSSACDQATEIIEAVSVNGTAGGSMKKGFNESLQTVSRKLLTPGEVRRLRAPTKTAQGVITAPGQTVVFVNGQFPTLADQALYFMDPEFCYRASIAPPPTDKLGFPAPQKPATRRSVQRVR